MFTGLVQCTAEIVSWVPQGSGCDLQVVPADTLPIPDLGDSIAISGCCLTVTAVEAANARWTFQAGQETLSRTKLGQLQVGSLVNLETSMCLGDKIGGHLVTGHVDAVGHLDSVQEDGPWRTYWFKVPESLSRQLASKGSIAIDGVSLTLVDVTSDRFSVALIPHTLSVTTLGQLQVGDPVNLETDVLAKYVQRQLEFLPLDRTST